MPPHHWRRQPGQALLLVRRHWAGAAMSTPRKCPACLGFGWVIGSLVARGGAVLVATRECEQCERRNLPATLVVDSGAHYTIPTTWHWELLTP